MKKIKLQLLVTVLSVLTFSLNAQTEQKGFISVALGPSIPIGDFASTDINKEEAGFANAGAIFDLTFGYKLNKQYGFMAMLRGQANPFDTEALETALENDNPSVNWNVTGDSWGIGGFLLGGFRSVPVDENGKTNFQLRALIGFLNSSSPGYSFTASSSGGVVASGRQFSASATAFSYLLGVGFTHKIASNFNVLVNLDYMGANPEFSNVESTTTIGGQTTVSTSTFSQSFGAINFSGGVAYLF